MTISQVYVTTLDRNVSVPHTEAVLSEGRVFTDYWHPSEACEVAP